MKKSEIFSSAISSSFLESRETINTKNTSFDFDGWVKHLFSSQGPKYNILDLFCGRGKQVGIISEVWPEANITCVDVSDESIIYVDKTLPKVNAVCEKVDEFISSCNKRNFDLITAFYGLYYVEDQDKLLSGIVNNLSDDGVFIVCGPYGNNNLSLYNLILKYQEIDEFVMHTSTDFMMVLKDRLINLGMDVLEKNKINKISLKSAEEVINYLLNTTFFDKSISLDVKRDLDEHFRDNDSFIIEKHIKLIESKKNES